LQFSDRFIAGNNILINKALIYLTFIWSSRLSNIEKISEASFQENYFSIHHFISDSTWNYQEVFDQISQTTNKMFSLSNKLTGLYIDESGNTKKGKHSVGVAKQYCGNVGKIENSQVAVFASLGNNDFSTLVDGKIYLPKEWTKNKKRCKKAGIPEQEQIFKTKQQLALEIIERQQNLGVQFDFISFDALYGADQPFTDSLDNKALTFMGDIRSNQHIFLEEPEIEVPERKGNRGRIPKNRKAKGESIEVSGYIKSIPLNDWVEIKVRNTAKGKLRELYHFKTVYIWDGKSPKASKRTLVIRKSKRKKRPEIKYSLTNADLVQFTGKALAYMQAQRFFIEHNFKEAKSILGMDQFQTRKWIAWYHQIALVLILLLFIMKEKIINIVVMPLISANDIKQLLAFVLAKNITFDQLITQIVNRNKIRQADINRYYSIC